MARLIAFLIVSLTAIPTLNAAAPGTSQPNILIFYLDDMGWAQPGAYGGKLAPTPHMDSMAIHGVRFTNGYSSGCVCSPGRVGLMTGRYQARTGHDANPTKAGRELLLSERTMAQYLQEAGYTTGIVGKWHLGDTEPQFLPTARGFEYAIGTVGNLGEGKGPSFYRANELMKELEGAPITSPIYAREACSFIEANKSKPFFLYLSFNAVHSPIVASQAWLEKFKHLDKREQGYAALIGEADEAIGKVMSKLRELRIEENTLVFCISDNGGASPISEQMGLRGHKWFVWEGGIRVTWMAQWKGHIAGGQVIDEPVIQVDVLPTVLAAANAAKPEVLIDGVNLLPLMEGKSKQLAERELYFRFGVQHAVRKGDWKLVKASKEMEPMLVNLKQDPGEQRDLSLDQPAKKAELQSLFDQWNARMQPPRWEDLRWNGDEDRKANNKKKQKNKA
jgi:arylsulfatase A-like enzyme